MKTIRSLFALLCLFGLVGCSQRVSQFELRKQFPAADIEPVPGRNYEWLVRDGTNLYYVIYCGFSQNPSDMANFRHDCVTPLFRP